MKDRNTYFGGKGADGTYQTIINHIRPHDIFIELFAGYASISKRKRKAGCSTELIELDPEVCKKLEKELEIPDYIVMNMSAFDYLKGMIQFLSTTSLKIVVFADPPYPVSCRVSEHKYKFDLTDAQHVELLGLLMKLPCDVIICTKPNDLYKVLLKDWKLVEYMNNTHAGAQLEWLFMNYEEITELHDDSYLGSTHRERQLIRKKMRRWKRNLANMPVLQQKFMLRQLNGVIQEGNAK